MRAITRPQVEVWILTVETLAGERQFTFRLRGSVTGEDGVGRTDEDFTSTSGRVAIRATDWYWAAYRGGLEPGFTVRWSTALWGGGLRRSRRLLALD